jgi:ATP-dependent helicase/nuclease subunit A
MSGPRPPIPSPKGRGSVDTPPPLLGGGRGEEPSPRDRTNAEQLSASDPAVSAFVAASAGSGKTKLLTDRLLRLMLAGAKPERIQCLTFTKAAAAEMAVRLQKTLGKWVTLDDAALACELRTLAVEPGQQALRDARALFAKVLDLPGGMRIGTIHAFCQSLLRRFPLEAALSPHFRLVDDRDAEDALTEARETMLANASSPRLRAALETLAGLASADQFGQHVATLQADLPRLRGALDLGEDLEAAQRRALGVTAANEAEIIAHAVNWQPERDLREAALVVQRLGSKQCSERATRILDWLGLEHADRSEHWQHWCGEFLTKEGKPRAESRFVSKAVTDSNPDLIRCFVTECERIIEVIDTCLALRVAAVSAALLTLAAPVLSAYAAHKEASGLLDYDDLIGRTSQLLVDPGAAWVLYKLDGGLDHLLLDEVQDTAPAQWRIAHALSAEFFAGEAAQVTDRTVFAVGDRKQSIYSFQGADIEEFDRSHTRLAARVSAAGKPWREAQLDVSFRSTRPVLELVDRVFANPTAAAGVVERGQTLTHYADRANHAGTVELWPLAPVPEAIEPTPWAVPEQNQGMTSAPQLLAETLARWIAHAAGGGVMLESKRRPLAPGDVMVLVRRRNDFGRALVRALKSHGVPVAGLDRLMLTEQPAVQDLIALADSLLLPQDDLTFACLLTSPLGGLSDDSMMDLAIGRRGALWEALRERANERPDWQAAWAFFAAMFARVDYVSPHALFAEALGPLGGRARLFARLGPEAAEPVDELLNAALSYGRMHPPSLQGFLHWLRRSGAEVKREAEGAGKLIRVMTVHGAKGLQAPLVILPDTTSLPPDSGSILWATDPGTDRTVPIWSPRREVRCAAAQRLREQAATRRMEEHNRLLYVALTRAEDRLVICGWQTRRTMDDACWYRLVERGFDDLPAEHEAFGAWDGELRRHATPQLAEPASGTVEDTGARVSELPSWAGRSPDWRAEPLPAEPARPERLAPSRPEGAELGPVPASASPLAARAVATNRFRRGRLIHGLLQHLPDLPTERRAMAARAWLDRPGTGLAAGEADMLVAETLAILDHPGLAPLFGPGSRAEVPLTGVIAGAVIGGLVDRLAVLADRVLMADFKTNRRPPGRIEDTPVLYLRQMAAYRAVLREIFPDRDIVCALVWTQASQAVILPDALLQTHAPGSATGQAPSYARDAA